MLIPGLLLAQLAASVIQGGDSIYANEQLRRAVQSAAVANRVAPAALSAYRAHLETEIALIIVDTLGRERTGQVEQLGGTATWSAVTGYEAHVGGYRSQSAGIPMPMIGFLRGWSLPMLYGQRLLIGIEGNRAPTERRPRTEGRRDSLIAVHPFATDRERYYRFAGGDTIAVLTTPARRIPLLRITVSPNLEVDAPFAAFEGEIDIDADRHEIVRMRGKFVVSRARERSYSGLSRLITMATGTVAVAYVEFVNSEYDQKYWLPATQRMEFQATLAIYGGRRSVFRIVSRFSDMEIDDTSTVAHAPVAYTRRRVTFAPPDSMSAFSDWRSGLGVAASSVGANDFEDIAPPDWKGAGPPQLSFYPSRFERAIHYNRIEGLFTGGEISLALRGAAPGVVARAHGGWAWSERTVRGGASVTRAWSLSTTAMQFERRLASTGDFESDLGGSGSSVASFLGSVEEVDYVDRWTAGVAHTRILGSIDRAFVTGRIAAGRDRDVAATLTHGPIRRSVHFLPNRHAATGSYGLASVALELRPNVSDESLQPGIGSTMSVEGAAGELAWIRAEASASARRYLGSFTLAARVDAGAVFSGNPPPQTLFELGGANARLSGYDYKEFAGDRAAVFRGFAAYAFPVLRAPYRIGRFVIPGLTPGLGAGIGGGWTELSTPAAQRAVLALGDGTTANALSRATARVRTTASAGLTFFSHSVHVGAARPIDHPAPWRWTIRFGQGF